MDAQREETGFGAEEVRFRDLVDLSPDGILVNLGGRIVFANARAASLFGVPSPAALVGRSPFEIFHPEHHEAIRQRVGRLLAGEPAAPFLRQRLTGADGRERWADVAASAFDASGGRAIQVVLRDATAQVEAEARLRRFELIAGQVRDIVLFIRREDGRILEANQAALEAYGYAREDLLARSVRDLRADGSAGPTAQQMAQADAGGVLFEADHRRRDGTTFPVEVSSRGATVDGVRMLVSVVRDVTERRCAERALRRREAQFSGVVEGLSEGLILSTLDGELIHWNRAALALHGYESVEEVRRRLPEFQEVYEVATLEGRVLPLEEWPIPRVLRGEPVRDLELVLRRKRTGWSRVFSYGGRVVQGADGAPLAFLTVADVTGRHRAQAELAAERDRLAVTLASIGDGVIATDLARRITDFNPVAAALTGWPTGEALGRPVHEVFRIVHEETRAPVANPLDRAIDEGRTVGLANHTALLARDGLERPIADSAAPIRGPDGRVAGAVLVFRDQTEERRAERALRQSEARLRTLAESLPQLAWSAGADGRLDWFNQRWRDYTGQAPGQEAWEPALHPDDSGAIQAMWAGAVARGSSFEVEHRLRRADGTWRWFLRRAALLGEGAEARWFGTCTDIHDLKESQRVLRDAGKLKEDFLSMASHEFRTPLTALHLQAELLRRDLARSAAPDPRAGQHLAALEAQLGRLDKLIGLLLDASRAAAGRLELERAETDLAEVAGAVVERFRLEADRLGCALALTARPVVGRWDPHRLDQVITNLVGNALKYGDRRPVQVEVGERDGLGLVAVRDQGVGIPPESLGRIFERFERGANTGRVKGLGLGLWIARQLVELHGGDIAVESAPGAGTCFTVTLPRA